MQITNKIYKYQIIRSHEQNSKLCEHYTILNPHLLSRKHFKTYTYIYTHKLVETNDSK